MLEPTEADIPALFLVLVVLPLVVYILLGKWGEAAKKKERVSLLAQLAAEEALRAGGMAAAAVMPQVPFSTNGAREMAAAAVIPQVRFSTNGTREMAAATVIPQVPFSTNAASTVPHFSSSKNGHHVCARCFAPAKTRCSRCKSVRYCSGNCQIIHWRQVHKHECHLLETNDSSSSSGVSDHGRVLLNDTINSQFFGFSSEQTAMQNSTSDDVFDSTGTSPPSSLTDCSAIDSSPVQWGHCNPNIESSAGGFVGFSGISGEPSGNVNTGRNYSDVIVTRSRENVVSEGESSRKLNVDSSCGDICGEPTSRNTTNDSQQCQSQHGMISEPKSCYGYLNPPYVVKNGMNVHSVKTNIIPEVGDCSKIDNGFHDEMVGSNNSEMVSKKGGVKAKAGLHPHRNKTSRLPKSNINTLRRQSCSDRDRNDHVSDESKSKVIDTDGKDGAETMGIMRMMGLKKSTRGASHDTAEVIGDKCRKKKMLCAYEDFVKYFQCEVYDIYPRGLFNCGNSCYANAVLQCLTSTKPLVIYLLHRSHSRACRGKDWCLMCELEAHAMMLREGGGPLSPSRILYHIRSINCQLGDGSQEDAHEFLRLLIASMQSICLERLGGESKVHPRLQETTFIQHTFGGRLQSKVQCLRCHNESERYENIMDLTLEIFGWVESLEDALTQFTTPEDLDGENMYRCGRCATYVRARKQLSIHEAPNILTIVLKRFQEGKYGKINKCIAFPEMLDMIPFMTGTSDIPPLYTLYGVVVHLDTLNDSFSGHYVSYVKDLQGNWFRIDDTEVQPVSISQVMSEGAYILFYMRSWPRTQGPFTGKSVEQPGRVQKASRSGESQSRNYCVAPEPLCDLRPETTTGFSRKSNGTPRNEDRNILPHLEMFAEPASIEFADATSSDWSLFTSSDEASFTTESTRDSFSTVDYADACNIDPLSIFNNLYGQDYPAHRTACCRNYSNSKAETRFVSEEKGYILNSYAASQSLGRTRKGEDVKQFMHSSPEIACNPNCSVSVKRGSKPKYGISRTSVHCKH